MALDSDTRALLKGVSRSMYISLAVLPEPVRDAMGLGYLLCRAADTISDTRIVPIATRRKTLDDFAAAFDGGLAVPPKIAASLVEHQASEKEKILLERLSDCVALWKRFPNEERALLKRVVDGVVDGMRMDLSLFSGDSLDTLNALPDADSLERYCAFIGGEPGRFWTDLCLLRLPEMNGVDDDKLRSLGIRLGKGLQITNILRDMPRDLRIGRCYLPASELLSAGLSVHDLLVPASLSCVRPILKKWLAWGLEHLDSGEEYVLSLPNIRLRAAAAWPLLLSLKTLALTAKSKDLLDARKRVKAGRGSVYGLMAASAWTLSSEKRFKAQYAAARKELEAVLES